MTANTLERDCRFCSVISKTNGEGPIGSAGTYEHWIIAEIFQPWDDTIRILVPSQFLNASRIANTLSLKKHDYLSRQPVNPGCLKLSRPPG